MCRQGKLYFQIDASFINSNFISVAFCWRLIVRSIARRVAIVSAALILSVALPGVSYLARPVLSAHQAQGYDDADRRLVRSLMITRQFDARSIRAERLPYAGYVISRQDLEIDPMVACKLKASNPDALIMLDQEGGAVVRLRVEGAVPRDPALATQISPDAYRDEAALVARKLREHCMDVNLAPVVEPNNHGRSASKDRKVMVTYAKAFADGMRDGGVTPTLKHFPGSTGYSEYKPLTGIVDARPGSELRYVLRSFDGNVKDHLADWMAPENTMVMLSNSIYPEYSDKPAVLDPIYMRWLREDIGFNGVVMTDALEELWVSRANAVAAMKNTDLLMVCNFQAADIEAFILDALTKGEITREELLAKHARVDRQRMLMRSTRGKITP